MIACQPMVIQQDMMESIQIFYQSIKLIGKRKQLISPSYVIRHSSISFSENFYYSLVSNNYGVYPSFTNITKIMLRYLFSQQRKVESKKLISKKQKENRKEKESPSKIETICSSSIKDGLCSSYSAIHYMLNMQNGVFYMVLLYRRQFLMVVMLIYFILIRQDYYTTLVM